MNHNACPLCFIQKSLYICRGVFGHSRSIDMFDLSPKGLGAKRAQSPAIPGAQVSPIRLTAAMNFRSTICDAFELDAVVFAVGV